MNMVTVRASDVLDQWLGGSEAILRSLFHRARSASPCILFFDEIDAIASNREIEGAEGEVSSRILSTLLNEMDGVSSLHDSGVLVLACTNRLEQVDPALLRPGRLEEHIELKLPTALEIKGILELCFAKIPIASEVNLMDFAEVFNELGATPADIVGVVRDACSAAVKENRLGEGESSDVTYVHLDNALRGWKK
jgi:SpoVK/Ycf46/Vps4 family AAA+-type ATPase